jgi:hypothetical protein
MMAVNDGDGFGAAGLTASLLKRYNSRILSGNMTISLTGRSLSQFCRAAWLL